MSLFFLLYYFLKILIQISLGELIELIDFLFVIYRPKKLIIWWAYFSSLLLLIFLSVFISS